MAKDCFELNGTVTKVKPSTTFDVLLENGTTVECTISGRLRKNKIRILLNDSVIVEMSPYDLSKGRISYRNK